MGSVHVRLNEETPVTVPALTATDNQSLTTHYIGTLKKTYSGDHWVWKPLMDRSLCREPEDPGSHGSSGISLDLVSLRSLVKMGQHGNCCCHTLLLESLHTHTTLPWLRDRAEHIFPGPKVRAESQITFIQECAVSHIPHRAPGHDRTVSWNGQNLKNKKSSKLHLERLNNFILSWGCNSIGRVLA